MEGILADSGLYFYINELQKRWRWKLHWEWMEGKALLAWNWVYKVLWLDYSCENYRH